MIQRQNGFTLMEILMALVIFIIGSISIYALFLSSIETHKNAQSEHQIALMAQTIIAELKVSEAIPKNSGKGWKHPNFPEYTYDILYTDIGNDAVLVSLKILYKKRGNTEEELFNTVVYRKEK